MNHSMKTGFSFGLTSGIITTLGLMVGLEAGTSSKAIVLGGILTIAIADAFSDALGIHVSEESENHHTTREIWMSTASTFIFKFLIALTFTLPVLLVELNSAILISIIWGISVLTILSYNMAMHEKKSPLKVITEHIAIALTVIILTHYTGDLISKIFS